MVSFTEPFKSRKKHCRVKKEHDSNKHFIIRGRSHCKDCKGLFFSKLIILQLGIKIMIVNTVTSSSSCLILQTELYRHRDVQF